MALKFFKSFEHCRAASTVILVLNSTPLLPSCHVEFIHSLCHDFLKASDLKVEMEN